MTLDSVAEEDTFTVSCLDYTDASIVPEFAAANGWTVLESGFERVYVKRAPGNITD